MHNTTTTRPALVLNALTLNCASAAEHVEYARRIGAELGHDIDAMVEAYTYLTRWALSNFDANTALPVLRAMGIALDQGRGI